MDVDEGRQPLSNADGTAYIAANGEIYNHRRIREQLGHEMFRTGSDSEAALHLLMIDGPAGLAKLGGMFALAWANTDGEFMVARDSLGIKPLYWAEREDCMLFASELGAFDEADRPNVESFPPGYCWSPAGGLVQFDEVVPVHAHPAKRADEPGVWDESLLKTVRETIVTAVEDRMMSDVGAGVFLSGGLDSAIVAAVAAEWAKQKGQPLPTFAVGAEGSSDLAAARVVAEYLGTEHHEIVMTKEDAKRMLPKAVRAIEHYDPSLVRSAVPNMLLAEYASKRVRVVLTGEGADELFAGYSYYHDEPFTNPDALQAELVRTLAELHHLNLQRCDRTTMAYGMEGRVPFLDRKVIEVAMKIPPEHKMIRDGVEEKKLLRDAFEGWVPDDILRRGKEQFGDGSGASDVLDDAVAESPEIADGDRSDVNLRTREEESYYSIWREALPGIVSSKTLGNFAMT
jgi:asparagine synthase (glutamine-hydrolysing)